MGIGYIMNPQRGGYAMPLGPGYQNMAANQAGIESILGGLKSIQDAQKQRAESQLLERLGGVSDRAGLERVLAETAANRGGGGIMGGILNSVNPFGSYGGMTGMERNMRGSMLGPLLEDPLRRQMQQERLTGAQLGNQAAKFGVDRLPTEAAWQDKSRGRQENLWGEEDTDRARRRGREDLQENRTLNFLWPQQETQWGWDQQAHQQGQEDRTRQLGEHQEDRDWLTGTVRPHERFGMGRDMKRRQYDEKVQDQQIELNQQKLEAGSLALKDAQTPRPAGPDYKRSDALIKADSQLAEIEEYIKTIPRDLTPQEAIRLQKAQEQREEIRVQLGESLGVAGRPVTPLDMLGRYRFHDPGLFGKPRLEVNVGGGAEGEKWKKAADEQGIEFYQILESVAASLDQVDPQQAAALRQIMTDGDPEKIQQALDLIMRLRQNGQ